jgi:hypothetical protein
MRDQSQYDEVYEHFRRRYRRRDRLTYHMMAWFIVNAALWMVWLFTHPDESSSPELLRFSGLWMCLVLGHMLNYVGSEFIARGRTGGLQRRMRNIVHTALDREDAPPPKPKRRDWMDSRTRLILTEDGQYVDEDDQSIPSPRREERHP